MMEAAVVHKAARLRADYAALTVEKVEAEVGTSWRAQLLGFWKQMLGHSERFEKLRTLSALSEVVEASR